MRQRFCRAAKPVGPGCGAALPSRCTCISRSSRRGAVLKRIQSSANLRFMLEHPEMPDAHNASAFLDCYRRMGEFIPQLVAEGKSPRIMLDYSGASCTDCG